MEFVCTAQLRYNMFIHSSFIRIHLDNYIHKIAVIGSEHPIDTFSTFTIQMSKTMNKLSVIYCASSNPAKVDCGVKCARSSIKSTFNITSAAL